MHLIIWQLLFFSYSSIDTVSTLRYSGSSHKKHNQLSCVVENILWHEKITQHIVIICFIYKFGIRKLNFGMSSIFSKNLVKNTLSIFRHLHFYNFNSLEHYKNIFFLQLKLKFYLPIIIYKDTFYLKIIILIDYTEAFKIKQLDKEKIQWQLNSVILC